MSGYREHGFDPNAWQETGSPARPYNWVQWAGTVLAGAGVLLSSLHLAGKAGWIPRWVEDPSPWALILLILGVVLINSRRHPATDLAPELAAARKRWLLIIVAICVVVLGLAAVIEIQGA